MHMLPALLVNGTLRNELRSLRKLFLPREHSSSYNQAAARRRRPPPPAAVAGTAFLAATISLFYGCDYLSLSSAPSLL